MATNKDGIGNTIEVKDYALVPTKDGATLTIKGPYENVVVNFSRQELDNMVTKSHVLEARHKMAEREAGNEERWYGHSR